VIWCGVKVIAYGELSYARIEYRKDDSAALRYPEVISLWVVSRR
jgi:hypothetical protein